MPLASEHRTITELKRVDRTPYVCVCLFLKIDSYSELKISEAKITLLHILNRGTGWLFVTMKQNIPDKKFLLFLKFASLDVFHSPETAGNSPA